MGTERTESTLGMVKDREWTLTVHFHFTPMCPACGRPLQAQVGTFYASYCFCPECVNLPTDTLARIIVTMQDPRLARHLTHQRGLFFWTPRTYGRKTALERLIEVEAHRHKPAAESHLQNP